ncbi:histidinol-phosphatase HisJ [Alteribacillus iranensis]|uniref:Histidinol-phosphatase n=1 Tax=Alteribacillus iranensis TaxID=930128 RepID=A0A1I2CHB8_9BACI|nr:histidinol-phosphatase HisJ [Alteribacillus iranensis]SFE67721.1 histidinol-phosphate phosphatase [Alteribacillus iranensis]
MRIKKDGHIHTPYCPHGSSDTFKKYIERAIEENVTTITFTEHAPLPSGFTDPVPNQDSSMPLSEINNYFNEIERLKNYYKNDITILTGLEVDYIEGFEKEVRSFLNEYGPLLDDSILSVHFLKANQQYICLDYSPTSFQELVSETGSVEKVVQLYFDTLLLSIHSDLGDFKPNRIGHMTLVRKFYKKYGDLDIKKQAIHVLDAVKTEGMELDYNGAGTAKPLCGEPYPSDYIALEAKKRGIPLVYGSDAHQAKDMMQGLNQMITI